MRKFTGNLDSSILMLPLPETETVIKGENLANYIEEEKHNKELVNEALEILNSSGYFIDNVIKALHVGLDGEKQRYATLTRVLPLCPGHTFAKTGSSILIPLTLLLSVS